MRGPAAFFPIALALGAIILAPVAGAREEGSTEIEKCQTISQPGSYKLVNNLTATGSPCLVITADAVTIDLAGFSISGNGFATGIQSTNRGTAVRNGSISNFFTGIDFGSAAGSIVEGLRVFGIAGNGIVAFRAIVKGNTVSGSTTGIQATGTITGNYVEDSSQTGLLVPDSSTLIGNTVAEIGTTGSVGIAVSCPSNVTDNTATGSALNLALGGDGCNNTNNVAP
jgi:hypothetical protein